MHPLGHYAFGIIAATAFLLYGNRLSRPSYDISILLAAGFISMFPDVLLYFGIELGNLISSLFLLHGLFDLVFVGILDVLVSVAFGAFAVASFLHILYIDAEDGRVFDIDPQQQQD